MLCVLKGRQVMVACFLVVAGLLCLCERLAGSTSSSRLEPLGSAQLPEASSISTAGATAAALLQLLLGAHISPPRFSPGSYSNVTAGEAAALADASQHPGQGARCPHEPCHTCCKLTRDNAAGRNRLESPAAIAVLRPLKRLRSLTLAGNPVAAGPAARSWAIAHLPGLVFLDHAHVSPADIAAVREQFQARSCAI